MDLETRLAELEARYAFLDDLVAQLDSVIVQHQGSIERLQRELALTRERLAEQSAGDRETTPEHERPPHY